jgi:hypothetical protein
MENQKINEERIDAAFEAVEKLRRSAWNLAVAEVAALSERVRVEIMIDKSMIGSQKRWYRAFSDYLDDVVEERMEKEGVDRDKFHDWVLRYVRGFLNSD